MRLINEAVDILANTDAVVWKADTFVDQAIVLTQASRTEEAIVALRRARELYHPESCQPAVAPSRRASRGPRGALGLGRLHRARELSAAPVENNANWRGYPALLT